MKEPKVLYLITITTTLELEGDQEKVDSFANDMQDIIKNLYEKLLEERYTDLILTDDDVDVDVFDYDKRDDLEDIRSDDVYLLGKL